VDVIRKTKLIDASRIAIEFLSNKQQQQLALKVSTHVAAASVE